MKSNELNPASRSLGVGVLYPRETRPVSTARRCKSSRLGLYVLLTVTVSPRKYAASFLLERIQVVSWSSRLGSDGDLHATVPVNGRVIGGRMPCGPYPACRTSDPDPCRSVFRGTTCLGIGNPPRNPQRVDSPASAAPMSFSCFSHLQSSTIHPNPNTTITHLQLRTTTANPTIPSTTVLNPTISNHDHAR